MITQLILAGGIMDILGSFKEPGHKVWVWRLDNDKKSLMHIKGEVMDIYKPSWIRSYATTSNHWTRVRLYMTAITVGKVCTIREVAPEVIVVFSQTDPPPTPLIHDFFLDILVKWGCTCMWDSTVLIGNDDWIEKDIYNQSCVVFTDGSKMRVRRNCT